MPRQAFTLVELLLTISVIACLAAILLPAISMVRQRALELSCLSNLRQIGLASLAYAGDHRGVMVPGRMTTDRTARPDFAQVYWEDLLVPYLGDDPQAAGRIVRNGCFHFRDFGNTYLPFPGGERFGTGYGFNNYLHAGETDGWRYLQSDPKSPVEEAGLQSVGKIVRFSRLSSLSHASERILLGDANDPFIEAHLDLNAVGQFWKYDGQRHRGRANYVFTDGRAGGLGPIQAWYALANPGADQ